MEKLTEEPQRRTDKVRCESVCVGSRQPGAYPVSVHTALWPVYNVRHSSVDATATCGGVFGHRVESADEPPAVQHRPLHALVKRGDIAGYSKSTRVYPYSGPLLPSALIKSFVRLISILLFAIASS